MSQLINYSGLTRTDWVNHIFNNNQENRYLDYITLKDYQLWIAAHDYVHGLVCPACGESIKRYTRTLNIIHIDFQGKAAISFLDK